MLTSFCLGECRRKYVDARLATAPMFIGTVIVFEYWGLCLARDE